MSALEYAQHAADHRVVGILNAALDYARRGIPVFPCHPHTKHPLTKKDIDPSTGIDIPNSGGFRKATTDQVQIRSWWREFPNAMIGVPTGSRSGFWALDPDAPDEPGKPDGRLSLATLQDQHGKLPATHTHLTPGGGKHLLFKWLDDKPVTNREGAIAKKGINVRGEGGYIVMPPSVSSIGKAYLIEESLDWFNFAIAPEWLYDLILSPKPQSISERAVAQIQPPDILKSTPPQDRNRRYAGAALRSEADTVASTRLDRNNQLNNSALKLGSLIAAGELTQIEVVDALYNASVVNGYVASDGRSATMNTINSGLRKGMEKPRQIPERTLSRKTTSPVSLAAERERRLPISQTVGEVVSEDSAALAFREKHSGKLLFCHDAGCWFVWTGYQWRRERTGLAFEWTRQHVRELTLDQPPSIQQKCNKTSFAGGVEKFSRTERAFAAQSADWDADPFMVGTPSGTVDLRTGKVSAPRPEDRITRLTQAGPADTADCPTWLRFLKDSTGDDKELIHFLQQWCGYCLTGVTREHALVFVYGGGGNGKSVFMNTISGILGEYTTTAAMDTFTASRGDKHPTDLARLKGARLVTASETEKGHAWAEARIKSLTGGDKIAARFMRQNFFEFLPQFKLVVIGNHKPVLHNVDDAARRRFNIVPFIKKPEKPDRDLESKLQQEWPAILRWMIDGCIDWQKNGLVRPASVKETTEKYFSDQDLLGQWLAEKCNFKAGDDTKSDYVGALFDSWVKYCMDAGEPAGTKKAFSEALSSRGFNSTRGTGGVRMFNGLRLIQQGGFGEPGHPQNSDR
jgi:putative DNA primase/helicase